MEHCFNLYIFLFNFNLKVIHKLLKGCDKHTYNETCHILNEVYVVCVFLIIEHTFTF